jgi:wyosine [tRNA(Phe)-imidazoG37] synthetase (radical SAM superfamily)
MKYVFGPVPSRRLGQSLGIDPIPLKTCNWNCVYCQLGRSTPMTNRRASYYPSEAILAEVKSVLDDPNRGHIDWITFIGSGEPTLHSGLGELIRGVKAMTDIPVAVCTNGALLYQPDLRNELLPADAVMPTVSAGSDATHWHIHRPYPGLTFELHIEGLIAFRKAYRGRLWPEVMLIKGMNDTEAALLDIAAVLDQIGPDLVHIALPTRPPAETWVEPPDQEGLMRALAILGRRAAVLHPSAGIVELSGHMDVIDAILDIIARHPISQQDLELALQRWSPGQVSAALENLSHSGRAQKVQRYGIWFWTAAPAAYPDAVSSEAVSPERLRPRLRYHAPITGGEADETS